MKKFTNPLDNIKVASPCPANWNEMFGNERKRFCSECKLNVYNLSDMSRTEAENFLINAEGRVCVKFYRRADGSVLTRDCPVGLARVKRKISRVATAAFALVSGFFGGNLVFNQTAFDNSDLMRKVPVVSETPKETELIPFVGELPLDSDKIKPQIKKSKQAKEEMVLGRIENICPLKDEPVVLWIK